MKWIWLFYSLYLIYKNSFDVNIFGVKQLNIQYIYVIFV